MAEARIVLSAADQTRAAFDSASRNLSSLGSQIGSISASFGVLGVAAAAALSAAAFKNVINAADELNKLSQKTGITVESLSELKFAGELANVPIEAIAKGVKSLSTNMFDASNGSKDAAANFELMGVSIKASDGSLRSADDVLADVAQTFAGLQDGPEKAALAVKLFGKAGMDMIPMLNGGREGLLAMRQEARDLGAVISTETAQAAELFNDNLLRMSTLSGGLAREVAAGLLPTMNELTQAFIDWRKESKGTSLLVEGISVAFETITVLGANVAYVFKEIGYEIKGLGQQAAALATFDFAKAGQIRDAMVSGAQSRRQSVDDFSQKILFGREARRLEAEAGGGFGDGTIGQPSGKKKSLGNKPSVGGDDGMKAANKELKEQAKLLLELAGLTGTFTEDWNRLSTLYGKGTLNLKQLTEQQALLLGKQPAVRAQVELEQKLVETRQKNIEMSAKHIESLAAENDRQADANAKLQQENEAIGLNTLALNMLRLGRLDANIARTEESLVTAQNIEGNEAEIAQIERRIALLKGERALTDGGQRKQILADEMAANQKRTEDLSTSITEGLATGFRNGQSIADVFLNELKAQFAKTVLQPLIRPLIDSAFTGGGGGSGGTDWLGLAIQGASSYFGGGGLDQSGGTGTGDFSRMDRLSYDGGGSTGSGPRAGGLDGKGGFMAILHPQETVIDHTKGQSAGGSVVNNYSFGAGVSRAEAYEGYRRAKAEAVGDVIDGQRRRRFS